MGKVIEAGRRFFQPSRSVARAPGGNRSDMAVPCGDDNRAASARPTAEVVALLPPRRYRPTFGPGDIVDGGPMSALAAIAMVEPLNAARPGAGSLMPVMPRTKYPPPKNNEE